MTNLRTAANDTSVPDDFVLLGADATNSTTPSKFSAAAVSEAVAKKAFSMVQDFAGDPTTAFIPLVNAQGQLIGRTPLREFADPFTVGTPPGTVRNWIRRDTDPAFTIPAAGFGYHSDERVSGKAARYNPKAIRSHDTSVNQLNHFEMFPPFWINDDYSYNWNNVDPWINHFHSLGMKKMITWMGTRRAHAVDYAVSKYGPSVNYTNMSLHAPSDPSKVGQAVAALVARHGDKIDGIDIWNEPSFGFNGPIDINTTTWINNGPYSTSKGFCHMTAAELAEVARQLALNCGSVPLIGPGWEGQNLVFNTNTGEFDPPNLNYNYNSAVAFYIALDAAGVRPATRVNKFGFHTYIYNVADTQKILFEVLGYKALRDWLVANYGMAADLPLINSELGCENAAKSSSNYEKGRAIRRAVFINWGVGVEQVYIYRHSDAAIFGDPHNNADVEAMYQSCSDACGKTIRQMAELTDGRVWTRFSNNEEVVY